MATIRDSASGKPLRINHEGSTHELIITVRGGGIEQSLLTKLVGKTISTWMKAYTAVTNTTYVMPEGSKSACEQLDVEPHAVEPHCTVWNKAWNGISLTVHSNSDGQDAVDACNSIRDVEASLRENAPYLFENVSAPKAQNNSNASHPSPAPVTQSALSPFIRSTKAPFKVSGQIVPNTVGIEGGQMKSKNWNKPAMIAQGSYNKSAAGFDAGQVVLYRLEQRNDNVQVRGHNGKGILSFRLIGGDDIAIWERASTANADGSKYPTSWEKALDKLGLETVEQGQYFELKADFIAMKADKPYVNKSGDTVQYWEFYGFFTAPDGYDAPTQDSAGKQVLGEHFGKQYEPSSADVGDGDNIPF